MAFDARKMIVITGSTGRTGRRLMEQLAPHCRVVGLDVRPPETLPAGASFIDCDLTNEWMTRQAFTRLLEEHGGRVASLIHLATHRDFSGEPSTLYNALNIHGTQRLLREMRRLAVDQFLFVSSVMVMRPGEHAGDEGPDALEEEYPKELLKVERLLRAQLGPLPAVVLRAGGVYDDDCHMPALAEQIWNLYHRRGNGGEITRPVTVQPFVHLDDLVQAACSAVERRFDLDGFNTFLIAEPWALTEEKVREEVARLLFGEAGGSATAPRPARRVQRQRRYPVCVDKAEARLGWRPQHRVEKSLARMVERLQREPARWYQENRAAVH